jgi:hypothetical protein
MQSSWLGSAWLALGLDSLAFWNPPRIWSLDPEAPYTEGSELEAEAERPPPWDALDITVFI